MDGRDTGHDRERVHQKVVAEVGHVQRDLREGGRHGLNLFHTGLERTRHI